MKKSTSALLWAMCSICCVAAATHNAISGNILSVALYAVSAGLFGFNSGLQRGLALAAKE